MLVTPLLTLLLWGLCWQLLFAYADESNKTQEYLASIDHLVLPILTPLSFLLTFRLGRAAVRFWDSRRAVGLVIGICRANISVVAVGVMSPIRNGKRNKTRNTTQQNHNNHQTEKDEMQSSVESSDEENAIRLLCEYARCLAVFSIAMKHHVRPATRKGWNQEEKYKKQRYEIGTLLSDEDARNVILPNDDENCQPSLTGIRVRDPPLVVLNKLHQLAYNIAYCTYTSEEYTSSAPAAANRAMLYQQITNHLNELTNAYGAMERIKNTPLPFAYAIHLRTFLLLYLFLWNMISVAEYG